VNIDTNALPALSLTTDRAIAGARDTTLEVPPVLLPVIKAIQPLSVLSVSNVALRESFITEALINKNNPNAAGSQDICTLAKGLWTIQLNVSSFTLGTAGVWRNNFWAVNLAYQGFTLPLVRMLHVSTVGQHMNFEKTVRFLLREDATVNLSWLAPAAGEYIGVNLGLLATREL